MGIFSKIKNKIRKAIPKEVAPFLPAIASIYGGPMLASMFGGMNPILAQGLGAALADAGTQELTSDRTRLESSLFSGIMGGLRGSTGAYGSGRGVRDLSSPSFAIQKGTEGYKLLSGGEKALQGAQNFAMAPTGERGIDPGLFSISGASSVATTASPKLGYNEVERYNKEMAARAAENARLQGLSYEESLGYARNYYFGSNPDASEEDFNSFMDYYNSDLNNPSLANGGRVGFQEGGGGGGGSEYAGVERMGPMNDPNNPRYFNPATMRPEGKGQTEAYVQYIQNLPKDDPRKIEQITKGLGAGAAFVPPPERDPLRPPRFATPGEQIPNPIEIPDVGPFEPKPFTPTVSEPVDYAANMSSGVMALLQNPALMQFVSSGDYMPQFNQGGRVGFANGTSMPPGKPGALDSISDISLNMQAFYDEYPEAQVGSYINENRYKSEKIEKLENKLNEIIDMRKRTADRSRDSENMGMPSLMERVLEKEIMNLYFEREKDDIRKSEQQKRDEIKEMQQAEAAEKEKAFRDYYNNLNRYARPGRAMGGMMNAGMMDRPNFNYGSGRQTPQGDPIAPNVPPGMQMDLRPGGFIELGTKPRADDVPAMVGKDEFVLNDRAVAGIGKMLTGKPDPRAGARALYDVQEQMEAIV
jgi:hypothetical protein